MGLSEISIVAIRMVSVRSAVILATLIAIGTIVCGCDHRLRYDCAVRVRLVESTTNTCVVEYALTNTGLEPLFFEQTNLPWFIFTRGNTTAVVADDPYRTSIPYHALPVDAPLGHIVLQPRETSLGRCDLLEHYPTLRSNLDHWDAVFFWCYQPRPRNAPPLKRLSGCLVIPEHQSE